MTEPTTLHTARAMGAEKFKIPSAAAQADRLAGELGELATAAEWKRSAIVYARDRRSKAEYVDLDKIDEKMALEQK